MRHVVKSFLSVLVVASLAALSIVAARDQDAARSRFLELASRIAHAERQTHPRTDALTALAIECARAGQADKAAAAIADAAAGEKGASSADAWIGRNTRRLVEAGALAQAHQAIGFLTSPDAKVVELARVAQVEAQKGDAGTAVQSLRTASELVRQITSDRDRQQALMRLADACEVVGTREDTGPVLHELVAQAKELPAPDRDAALRRLAEAAHRVGLAGLAAEAGTGIGAAAARAGLLVDLAFLSEPGAVPALLGPAREAAAACEQREDQARLLARVAQLYAGAGDAAAADDALSQAAEAAAGLSESSAAGAARLEVVRAMLRLSRQGDALAVAEQIRAGGQKTTALSEVGSSYVSGGQFEKAVELGRSLPGQLAPSMYLARLAEECARRKDYAHARKVIEQMEGVSLRTRALQESARLAARGGELVEAVAFAGAIQTAASRNQALVEVVQEYMGMRTPSGAAGPGVRGEQDAAREAAGVRPSSFSPQERARRALELEPVVRGLSAAARDQPLLVLAGACLEVGDRDNALRIARQVELPVEAYSEFKMDLSALLARAGDLERATKLSRESIQYARRVTCSGCRRAKFAAIYSNAAASGQFDMLLEAARGAEDTGLIGESLVDLAVRELEAGRRDDAWRLLRQAFDMVRDVSYVDRRVELLASIGAAYEQGGLEWAEAEEKQAQALLALPAMPGAPAAASRGSVKLLFFSTPNCADCRQAKTLLEDIKKQRRQVSVREMSFARKDAIELNKGLCMKMGLPEGDHSVAPAVFGAGGAVVGRRVTKEGIEELIESSLGRTVLWETDPELRKLGGAALGREYEELTLPLVVGGGLLDGINPCAFAVIIFFVTYMTYVGKTRKEMALAGIVYTGAVFVTYLAIGLGLNELFEAIPLGARRVLHVIMIASLLVAAVLSFRDGLKCLQGQVEDVKLKLPEGAKRKIRQVMARQTRSGLTVAGALVMGVVVGLLEFPCTGQVYAPIVAHISQYPVGAIGWLLLYNLCFIVPLIVVFLCILFGVTSKQLAALFQRHMAKVKFALAALFVGLVAVLVLTMP